VTRRRHPATERARDSEPRPETIIDWLVWLALWPVVTVAWLVTVAFVLLYAAVGSTLEVLFGSDCSTATTPMDLNRPDEVLTNDSSITQPACSLSTPRGTDCSAASRKTRYRPAG